MTDYDPDVEADEPDFEDDGTADILDGDSPLKDLAELQARGRRLVELRTRRDQTKTAAETAKKEFEAFQAEFMEEYARSPIKGSVNIDLGDDTEIRLTPIRTPYARVLDRDAAEQYFRDRAKVKEYVKEDFRMGRLHELVRECIEQKKPLPPGLDFYTKEYFRVTMKD